MARVVPWESAMSRRRVAASAVSAAISAQYEEALRSG